MVAQFLQAIVCVYERSIAIIVDGMKKNPLRKEIILTICEFKKHSAKIYSTDDIRLFKGILYHCRIVKII